MGYSSSTEDRQRGAEVMVCLCGLTAGACVLCVTGPGLARVLRHCAAALHLS